MAKNNSQPVTNTNCFLVGKITEKAVCKSIFDNMALYFGHCILSVELTKTQSSDFIPP